MPHSKRTVHVPLSLLDGCHNVIKYPRCYISKHNYNNKNNVIETRVKHNEKYPTLVYGDARRTKC